MCLMVLFTSVLSHHIDKITNKTGYCYTIICDTIIIIVIQERSHIIENRIVSVTSVKNHCVPRGKQSLVWDRDAFLSFSNMRKEVQPLFYFSECLWVFNMSLL